jgi:hypothetical protein
MQALVIGALTVLLLLVSSTAVNAQTTPVANSCKAKAKQVAADAYRSCVADEKNVQIEQIKRNYQVKMLALKKYYEDQLKKVSGPAAAAEKADDAEKAEKSESAPTPEVESTEIIEATDSKADESAQAVPTPEIEKFEALSAEEIKEEAMIAAEEKIEDELIAEPKQIEPVVQLKPIKAQPQPKAISKTKLNSKKIAAQPAKTVKKDLSKKIASKKLPSKKAPLTDDSIMDIPEPIPVNLKPSI